MRNTISKKYIVNYIEQNYGEFRQDINRFINAIRQTSKKYGLNKKDLFHYIIERKNTIKFATSFGFDTRYGREIREYFSYCYYK